MPDTDDPYRVLLVEDDEATRYVWRRGLASAGFEVIGVGSKQEALAELPNGYDVLLSDQKLTDGDGVELLLEATKAGLLTGTATLLCTAYTPTHLEKGMHLGVLRKPVDLEELVKVVERGAREARQLQRLNAARGAMRPRVAPEALAVEAGKAGVLGHFLQDQRARIVDRWKRRATALYGEEVRELELVDHTPQLLAELARVLLATDRREAVAVNAALHGAQRYRLGFNLESVVREYAALRETILELAAEEGREVSSPETELLTRYTLEAIAVAVKRYTGERERHR